MCLRNCWGRNRLQFRHAGSSASGGPGGLGMAGSAAGAGSISNRSDRKIVCGVSVRHIHLCREDLEILFGKGYELSVLRDLYNPGFASKETLTVVGPKLTCDTECKNTWSFEKQDSGRACQNRLHNTWD